MEAEIYNRMKEELLSELKESLLKELSKTEVMQEIIKVSLVPALRAAINDFDVIQVPLTVAEYSVLSGLSATAIYQRIHRGQLQFEKDGTRVLISPKELNVSLRGKLLRSMGANN